MVQYLLPFIIIIVFEGKTILYVMVGICNLGNKST